MSYRSNEELRANAIERGYVWTHEHVERLLTKYKHAGDGSDLPGGRYAEYDQSSRRWVLTRLEIDGPETEVGAIDGSSTDDAVIARVASWLLGEAGEP